MSDAFGAPEDSDYEECNECHLLKPRFAEFSPRHGHCERHARRVLDCAECEARRNHRFRQPRCKACDRARGVRKRCFDRLLRIVRDYPDDTIEEEDSSYSVVMVRGVRELPRAVVDQLRETAGPILRLDWDLTPLFRPDDLFAHVPPTIVEEPPRGARTYAPIFDIAAAAGAFGDAVLPERRGFVDTGLRTRAEDFVVTVAGHSMEPTLRDRSFCVFRQETTGPHHDRRVVLAQLQEIGDPEYGGRYAVKRLQWGGDGRRSLVLRLVPDNDAFGPIEVRPDKVRIVGVYLRPLATA